jgi:HK97 family phage major capsid protein
MTLSELQEKRNKLATEIRSLAEKHKSDKGWSKDDEQAWERENANYDETMKQIEQARKIDSRSTVLAEHDTRPQYDFDPIGSTEARNQVANGFSDQPMEVMFRAADGSEIRGVRGAAPVPRGDDNELRDLSPDFFGRTVAAMTTGNFDMLDRHERSLLTPSDEKGGFFLNPSLSGRFIDLARAATVTARAGMATIPMGGSELTIAGLASDPTAVWRAEGEAITASTMSFNAIRLKPKVLACMIPVTEELLEDASANIGTMIQSAMVAAMGQKLDQAAMFGAGGGSEPIGIVNTAGINTINSVGTPSDYGHISNALEDIYEANFPGQASDLSWISHPRDMGVLDRVVDAEGRPIMPTPMTAQVRKYQTTSVPKTLGGGAESQAIVGHFPNLVMGARYSGIRVQTFDTGQVTDEDSVTYNLATEYRILIRAVMRADFAVLRPSWFTVLNGITTT